MKASNIEHENETENAQNNNNNNNETTTTARPSAACNRNEETELAAMVNIDDDDGDGMLAVAAAAAAVPATTSSLSTPTIIAATAIETKTIVDAQQQQQIRNTSADAINFLIPTTTATTTLRYHQQQQSNNNSSSNSISGSSSLRKKRNRHTAKRNGNETTAAAAALTSSVIIVGDDGKNTLPHIKTSLSMTSLPPDDEKQESRDVIKAKLNLERPYNSLKKNVDNKLHRYSWGSGVSSSSLHSSATLGLGSGKDDLWAAIQTNYNYIMDTNLLDSCKEARYEIEGAATVMENTTDCCFKLLDETQRNEGGLCDDPKELRRWLRDMEHKLENAPTISEATLFSVAELQRNLAEHSVLYHEIVSHARVVSACIRAASERETQQQQQLLQQQEKQQQQQQTLNSNCSSFAEQNNSSLSSTDEQTTATATTKSSCSNSSCSTSGIEVKSLQQANTTTTTAAATTTTTTSTNPSSDAAIASTSNLNSNSFNSTSSASLHSHKKSEGNLERLQNRYHLLYLKAFEVQLWLDGLLRKKSSSANGDDTDEDDDDDEDVDDSYECDIDDDEAAATEDDLNEAVSDLESDITQNSSAYSELQRCNIEENLNETIQNNIKATTSSNQQQRDSIAPKADCEDGDDEDEEEDEDDNDIDEVDFTISKRAWPKLAYSAVILSNGGDNNKCGIVVGSRTTATLTDFEADSESSDLETVQILRRQRKVVHDYRYALQQQQQNQYKVATIAGFMQSSNTTTTKTSATATNQTLNALAHDLSTNQIADASPTSFMNMSCSATATSTPILKTNNNNNKMGLNVVSSSDSSQCQQQQQQQQLHMKINTTTNTTVATTQTQIQQQQQLLQTRSNNKMLSTSNKQKHIAVITPNTHNNNHCGVVESLNNKSPTVLRKRQQQSQQQYRYNDISKFNRSNRKSKNCAIFYFKHLDTDNETNYGGDGAADDADDVGSGGVLSSSAASHASDILKSADASSDDDEGWLYTATTTNTSLNSMQQVDGGLQSATVSSTTENLTTTTTAASSSTTTGSAIIVNSSMNISDDSDKENKEALSNNNNNNNNSNNNSNTDLLQLATTSAAIAHNSIIINSSNGTSSHCDSSCSSNDLATTTTTSATTVTTMQRQQQQQQQQQQLHRSEIELEINGNNNNSNNKTIHIISNNCYNNNNNINNNNNNNNSHNKPPKQQQQFQIADDVVDNGNAAKLNKTCFYTRADICNINVRPSEMPKQKKQHLSPGKRLPPRSPAKSAKSTSSNATMSPAKAKVSHESIKQLVLEAEHLVRVDETHKTPTKQKHSIVKISSTVKKREVSMPGPIKQRVQEWLEHQPSTPQQLSSNKTHETSSINSTVGHQQRTDDCEASGEASETDSIPQPGSDTSEGFTDSIATCMQTSTNSYGASTERIGGSAEPISSTPTTNTTPLCGGYGSSNQSLNVKIVKRQQTRRKSDRPWSVSCLSQLTTEPTKNAVTVKDVQAGLATHSISESALDSLSPGRPRAASASTTKQKYDSKGSLKRRKTRKKKLSASAGKKTDSGSEEHNNDLPKLTQSLLMKSCESMSPQQIHEITTALLSLQHSSAEQLQLSPKLHQTTLQQRDQQLLQPHESEEESQLMKPNFRVGSYTTAYMANEARLGSLAALATYMNEDEQQGEYTTGTEDHHSSFSETAWDNYQEKYNSENYSEGFDSDAARRLMEFGDDYRNFIDSQSDCCSSLSAANNLDSFSPPRMDSLQQNELKMLITQDTIVSSVDHARRRRALELEYERRRKTLEVRRKSCQEITETQQQQLQPQQRSPTISLSSSANALTPKNADKFNFQQKVDSASRKLEFGMSHSAQSLRRTSESDTSTRRRKAADERRRSSRNLEKCIKLIPATSSSSCDDSDDEKEMRNLLQQSRNGLEDTRSLKIRCHLLRPEDYTEIINTCRDNIRCLESVLRGPPGTVLSAQCVTQTKDLLAAWEDLLGWSENAAAARKMQEEMIILKHSLYRLSNKSSFELLDTEPAIQIAIEALKHDKSQLQTYRTSMLRLNASVHSWLTRQERRLQAALIEQQLKEAAAKVTEVAAAATATAGELTEENEEAESEQQITEKLVQQKVHSITVTDSNGNQVEAHHTSAATTATTQTAEAGTITTSTKAASTVAVGVDKMWDLKTLMSAENEFHKHLKDEVSDMYSAWDEADARINTQLEVLTNSLIAWRQLECGLSEFQHALGQDRGTLKGLEGALDKGQATSVELAQNVKLVAKLLSEKVNVSQEQLIAVQEHLDPNHIFHIAKFTASNGSLSDSGISDGGTTSDGGLSERERRLGVLRRLAKQLESALAPGSDAMKSIAARMESAEAELKNLQNTCRDLIVRTATTHQNKKLQQQESSAGDAAALVSKPHGNGYLKTNGYAGGVKKLSAAAVAAAQHEQNSPTKRKNKRKPRKANQNVGDGDSTDAAAAAAAANASANKKTTNSSLVAAGGGGGGGDPADDPDLEFDLATSDDDADSKQQRRGWAWRIAKAAVPMQLALFTFLCAACLMQPNCCDNLNNLSMSFTPQLRYIRGPPPI